MNINQKYKELSINTIIFAAANMVARLISFLLVPFYTNVMTSTQFGSAELILNCSNIIIPIFSVSISDAVLRFGLDKKNDENSVLKDSMVVLIVGSIICVMFTPIFRLYSGLKGYEVHFTLLCITQMFRSTLCLYTKSINQTKKFAVDTIIYAGSLASANILFLTQLGLGVSGYLLAYVLANAISITYITFSIGIIRRVMSTKLNIVLLNGMLRYSIPMIINALSWWIINFSDRVMLEYYNGASEVGIYSASSKIPNILAAIISIFTQAWTLSSIMEYDGQRDKSFYSNIFKVYMLVLVCVTGTMIVVIKPFMNVYVGIDFIDSWKYVPFLLVANMFVAISSFVAPLYGATKKNINATITTMIAAIVNILLNFLFIPKWEIMGAVIATLVADVVLGLGRLFDTRRFFSFEISFVKFWLSIVLIVIESLLITYSNKHVMLSVFILFIVIILYLNDIKIVLCKVFKRKM